MKGCLRFVVRLVGVLIVVIIAVAATWTFRTNRMVDASEQYPQFQGAPGEILTIDGYTIHVQFIGNENNPPLLLLHGFGIEGGNTWGTFMADLSQDHYLIVPDMLGFGYSERHPEASPAYTHAGQAMLIKQALELFNIERVSVLGASYGGGVAAQFALDYPESTDKLILIGAQTYELGGGIFETLGSLPFGIGRALSWDAIGAGPRAAELATSGCETGDYCPSETEVLIRQRLAEIEGTASALVAFSRTETNSRIPAELGAIPNPTLLIWGDLDTTVPLENANRLNNEISNSELQILPGTHHAPYKERPAITAALVRDFVAR